MDTVSIAIAALQIAGSIVLDTLALVVWDIGTRSPLRLVGDVRRALARRTGFRRAAIRLMIGAFALGAGTMVSAPLATRPIDFTIIECWAIVTALVVEQLVGPDLRARVARGKPTT